MKLHERIDVDSIAYSTRNLTNTKDAQGVHQLYYRLRDLLKTIDTLPTSPIALTYDGRELISPAPITCLNYTDGYSRYGAYVHCGENEHLGLRILRQGIAPQLLSVDFEPLYHDLIMSKLSVSGFLLNDEARVIGYTGVNIYSGDRNTLPIYNPHLLDQFEVETVKERYDADFLNANWRQAQCKKQ